MSLILTYQEIQLRVFRYYPIYCRMKLQQKNKWGKGWVENELEVGYALDEMSGSLKHPVENLMVYTFGLVLAAGRESELSHSLFLDKIKKILSVHGLESLLETVSDEDAVEIKSDLKIVGAI